jgi:hypothetical protein
MNVIFALGKDIRSFLRVGISNIASPIAASLIKRILLIFSIGRRLFFLVNNARNMTIGIPK